MDPTKYNQEAWDREVAKGNQWNLPVSSEKIADAKRGIWNMVLTPQKAVPAEWFPPLR